MQRLFSESAIQLNAKDNIAIAKQALEMGTTLSMHDGTVLTIRQSVPVGHKFALQPVPKGSTVLRYGYEIGIATQSVERGDWVHTHNLAISGGSRELHFRVVEPLKPQAPTQTFLGYKRADGRVGTRNYITVISTVNCSSHVTVEIARAFTPDRLRTYPNVDGVIPLVHSTGCAYNPNDLAHTYLQRTLANIALNPNIGGYVFLSLGCEGNEIGNFCAHDSINLEIGALKPYPVAGTGMVVQDQGGFRKTVAAGIAAIKAMLPQVNAIARAPQPISELMLALQCGGSDAWSGVTANPLLGLVVDKLVQQGGTAVLSETPEIVGAEHLLSQRVVSREVADKLKRRFDWWESQSKLLNFRMDNNPSPGNKRGGLTTIFEKSLGAVAKGGGTPLNDVYEYAERVASRGLVLMDTPGYDPVSVTGQLAGGCNLIVFTTGRGSLFGSNIAPCVKVATNSTMYARMSDDMDFNAGQTLEGVPMSAAADALMGLIIQAASGQRTKSEEKGLPEYEFVPWQAGIVI